MGYLHSWGGGWVVQVRYVIGCCLIRAILQDGGLLVRFVQFEVQVLATIHGEC